jgi:hypothetical protein
MTDEELREFMARLRQSNEAVQRNRTAVPTNVGRSVQPSVPPPGVLAKAVQGATRVVVGVFWSVVVVVTVRRSWRTSGLCLP